MGVRSVCAVVAYVSVQLLRREKRTGSFVMMMQDKFSPVNVPIEACIGLCSSRRAPFYVCLVLRK